MTNILVTGANGQLGSELKNLNNKFLMLNYKAFFTTRDELDITNKLNVKDFCELNNIRIIINTAAYTAVDKAEEDKENANLVNNIAVKNLAQISKEQNIKLIHISTDYVFDGRNYKPYTEDNVTNPGGVYGRTKLDGENAMIEINPLNSIIIRTSWVYSSFGTPTYARDLAEALLQILNDECLILNDKVEIYNFSNEGVASWYDFAKEIMKMAKIECKINPIETKDYPTPAKRPHYSLLNKSKIKKEFDIIIPYWKDSLHMCLKELNATDR